MSRRGRPLAPLTALTLTLCACSEIPRPGYEASAGGDAHGSSDGGGSSSSTGGPLETSGSGSSSAGEGEVEGSSGESSSGGSSNGGSSSGGLAADSSTGEVVACDLSTHVCVPPAPAGWSGPVARAQVGANDETACGGAFGNAVASGGVNLVANAASCDCDCGSPSGDSCSDTSTAMYFAPNMPVQGTNLAGCEVPTNAFSIGAVAAASGSASSKWRFLPVGASGGSCAPMPTTNVPSAHFNQRVDLCGASDMPATCDDESLCMPQPDAEFEAGMCVWRYGDVTCPDAYPEKLLTHNDIDDDRGCSSCTCGTPSGQTCPDAAAYLFAGAAHEFPADGSCIQLSAGSNVTAAWFGGGSPEGGSCTPSAVHATGSANPIDALTVCCAGA